MSLPSPPSSDVVAARGRRACRCRRRPRGRRRRACRAGCRRRRGRRSRSAPRVPLSVSGALGAGQQREPGLDDEPRPACPATLDRAQARAGERGQDRDASCGARRRRTGARRRASRSRGRGRRRSAGARCTRRLARSTSAALRWMPRSLAPGATIARVPSGRDADAAAAVGAELDRGRDARRWPARSRTSRDARALLALARRRRRHPGAAVGVERTRPPRRRASRRRTSRPVSRSSTATLPPVWTTIARVVGDREVERRAGQLALAELARARDVDAPRSRRGARRTRACRRARRRARAACRSAARCRRRCARRGRSGETVAPGGDEAARRRPARRPRRACCPGSVTPPATLLLRVSISATFDVPVATSTTRA